jgi:hypothetical protein
VFLAAMTLAAIHFLAGALHFLHRLPRNRLLSAPEGSKFTHVFVYLLPELPAERESRFWPFAAGVAGYTFLLLLV